jgi:hypothetical protein
MITITDCSAPIYDRLNPDADPQYYVEFRRDGGPVEHGVVRCPVFIRSRGTLDALAALVEATSGPQR